MAARRHVYTGSPFERTAAYSRAVRVGDAIAVSGTAATGADGRALHPGDSYAQTRDALGRALDAVAELGGSPQTVTRTRLYLVPDADWRGAVRAHVDAVAAT